LLEEFMSSKSPVKVSLGIPVYNCERFVCDNASTDRTAEICEELTRQDSRIRYYRQEINIGAKANFNRVFEYSRGKYFKWVAADDICGPRYLELTVAALDEDPTAVLAHTRSAIINGNDEVVTPEELERGTIFDEGFPVDVRPVDGRRRFDAIRPHQRFQDILLGTYWCFEIFALIRREAMLLTYPKRAYYGSDKVMLAQLSLLGRFIELPEAQFFRRAHRGNSTNLTIKDREKWSNAPKAHWKLPTQFPCLEGYTSSVLHFPISATDRLKCLAVIARFVTRPDRYRSLARQMFKRDGRRKRASGVPTPTPVH
jgi:glycosyltransferase involved in cell wall biosynthesis